VDAQLERDKPRAPAVKASTGAEIAFTLATPADAPAVVEIRVAASRELTAQHGRGHWSSEPTERGIVADLRQSKVLIAWRGRDAIGTFRLSTRKPWAIDRSYFTDCKRAIYLTSMRCGQTFSSVAWDADVWKKRCAWCTHGRQMRFGSTRTTPRRALEDSTPGADFGKPGARRIVRSR
jgi:hypothetical protein